jgi:hypothetical protein
VRAASYASERDNFKSPPGFDQAGSETEKPGMIGLNGLQLNFFSESQFRNEKSGQIHDCDAHGEPSMIKYVMDD